MDNKSEKTFADLFSGSNIEDDNSATVNEEVVNGLSNVDEKNVTFDNLSNNNINNSGVISADLNDVKEVVNDLFSDSIIDNTGQTFDNPFMEIEKENNKDDVIFRQNNIEEDKNIITDTINNNSNVIQTELENTVSEQVGEVNNNEEVNPFLDISVTDKNLVNNDVSNNNIDNVFENNNLDSNELFNGNDIFGNTVDDNKNNMQSANPFLNDDRNVSGENNGESINKLVSEVAEKKNTPEEINSASVSPFFNNSSSGDVKNELVDNVFKNISVDETKNLNSKLDKIELNGTKNFNVKLVKKKISLLQFVTGVISYAFFIFLVLVLVTLLAYVLDIKIRAAKGDYSAPKFNAYVVLTGSMLPEIQVKDVVVTKKVETNDLEVGDVITFASSDSRFLGTIITHRIIKKNQDKDGRITFQTKGDNNNVADSALVQSNNIYGKVILKIPKLGYLQDFLATQGGWIIVILLPCVTVISYDVVKLGKGLKRRKINVIK